MQVLAILRHFIEIKEMKKILVILVVAFLRCLAIGAQGTVTVTQSEDIDALVMERKMLK